MSLKEELYAAILDRLSEKSEYTYQWPRWAAADEAASAVIEYLDTIAGPHVGRHRKKNVVKGELWIAPIDNSTPWKSLGGYR